MGTMKSKLCEREQRRYGVVHKLIASQDATKLVVALLQGINPNFYDSWGLTPLHRVCEMGDASLLEILLAFGANPNYRSLGVLGYATGLVTAASNGHTECVRLLLEAGADVNATDQWGNTALFKAASYNHVDCVIMLLTAGAEPDICNRWGATPLQYAAIQGFDEVVQALIDAGCDVNDRGETSSPCALHGAAIRGYAKCMRILLQAGVSVDYCDAEHRQKTALFYAIRYFNADVDCYTFSEITSSTQDRIECVKMLIAAGADTTIALTTYMRTSGHLGLSRAKDIEMHALLLRACHMPKPHTPEFSKLFQKAIIANAQEILQTMLSVGYTPNKADLACAAGTCEGVFDYLKDFQTEPRSLADLCRLTVRSNMTRKENNAITSCEKLDIPYLLRDFISVKDAVHYSKITIPSHNAITDDQPIHGYK